MALIGLAGIVFELVVMQAALGALHRVEGSFGDLQRISRAEQSFQDADQTHDALHADVLQALLEGRQGRPLPPDVVGDVDRDAAAFRRQLAAVDSAHLPAGLALKVRELRPVQLRYVATAQQLASLARQDPVAANRQLPVFQAVFVQLERGQAAVTLQLGQEVADADDRAARHQRAARWRIIVASLAGLLGLLGLAWLLNRLGRALTALLARERDVATTLQRSLLPDALPDLHGIGLEVRYVPGGVGTQVGGDWYDVFQLGTGRVGLVIGDVAGHDLRAASVMAQLRHALRAHAQQGLHPSEVLERLNELCLAQTPDELATCLYAVLDPVACTLEVSSAGHYAPMVVSPAGAVRSLAQPASPPVGAMRDVRYPSVRHAFEPGSTLVLFTDGLVERRGESVEDGLARLARLLAVPSDALGDLGDSLLAGMLGAKPPTDDVALLLVRPVAVLGTHLEGRWPADPTSLVQLRRTLERWLVEGGADRSEVYEIVVAASEAATNAIEHAYGPGEAHFEVRCDLNPDDSVVTIVVRDRGQWRSPRGRDRGRGLQLVKGLMDEAEVLTTASGTEVRLCRRLGRSTAALWDSRKEQVPT